MAEYVLTSPALRDLEQIYRYVYRDSGARMAERVRTKLYAAFEDLAKSPSLGHARPDVRRGDYLSWTVFRYEIVFRRKPYVVISRVIHGARDIPRRL